MDWFNAHQAQLFSLALVVFAAVVTRLMRLRPRLRYSVGHSWDMLVDVPLLDPDGKQLAPNQLVRTASITLGNDGLQGAKAVELAFNWKPPILNVWPARSYEEVTSSLGRYSLRFDSLAPKEQVTVEVMSFNQVLPAITAVRSEDCVGKDVQMNLQRVYPAWLNVSALLLLVLGAAAAIYLMISAVQAIARAPQSNSANPKAISNQS